MAHCLVFGGNGFIGSHLVEALVRAGHRVRVADVGVPRGDVSWSGIDYRTGSIGDEHFVRSCMDGIDAVYHLASTTVPSTSNRDPIADVQGNLVASLILMEAMVAAGLRRIVFFSSGGTVYGNPACVPVAEDHPLCPISSYGVVKVAIERYLLMYQAHGKLSPLILRPGNPYGPRQSTSGIQGVIASFLGRVRDGQSLEVWGDGNVVRDYIYISDLVALAVRGGSGDYCGIINAGSGSGASIREVIASIARVTGGAPVVDYLGGRGYDVRELVLDISRAKREFDWEPQVALEGGIAATWNWLRRE